MGGLPNDLIPIPTYPKQRARKSVTTVYRLSTSCWVVERPDHHCGDDLVFSTTRLSIMSPELIVVGDLNVHMNRPTDAAAVQLTGLLAFNGLTCHIDEPTHVPGVSSAS